MKLSNCTGKILGFAIKVHKACISYEVKRALYEAEQAGQFIDSYEQTVQRVLLEQSKLRSEYKAISKAANTLDIEVAREIRNLPTGY